MKLFAVASLALVAMTSFAALAGKPPPAEIDDVTTYLRSAAVPSAVKICGPASQDEARLRAAADAWLRDHQAAIERGHALAQAHPPAGYALVEAYNAAKIADMEARMAASDTEKARICSSFVSLVQPPVDVQQGD